MNRFWRPIVVIVILSIALSLAGCSLPAASPTEIGERVYNIQYFTDRTDVLHEYWEPASVAAVVTANNGTYHFSDGEMPIETIHEYVDAFEPGIEFVNEWFGPGGDLLRLYFIEYDFATVYSDPDISFDVSGSGADGVAYVDYDIHRKTPPEPFFASHVLAHESVHALCDVHGETTNFPKRPEPYPFFWAELLEEGLATMLEHMYGYNSERLRDVYLYHYMQSGYDASKSPLDEVGGVAKALDSLALAALENDEFFDELPYDILQSYYTSASFLYYLYERDGGGKDNLRRVYADINLMEEVYGKDIDDMIEEWLEYLERSTEK